MLAYVYASSALITLNIFGPRRDFLFALRRAMSLLGIFGGK